MITIKELFDEFVKDTNAFVFSNQRLYRDELGYNFFVSIEDQEYNAFCMIHDCTIWIAATYSIDWVEFLQKYFKLEKCYEGLELSPGTYKFRYYQMILTDEEKLEYLMTNFS